MAGKSPLNIVLGAGNIGDTSMDPMARFSTPDEVNGFLEAFYERGYREIDTARSYSPHAPGSSESRLGRIRAGQRFNIHTKVLSQDPGSHSTAKIEGSISDSLAALEVKEVDILYLHRPDRATPFEESCDAINSSFVQGKFRRFGLSNYRADEVEKIVKICEERGFVKPSVYQGQYNPIVRGAEEELFPILRKYGVAFYAWSPAGAGFFAGNHKNVQPGGRFDSSHFLGRVYSGQYQKPTIEAATDQMRDTAGKHGISGHAAALRWTVYHSRLSANFGDAVIVGASSPEQLRANLDMIKSGPLPADVVEAIEALHKVIGDKAIPYHL